MRGDKDEAINLRKLGKSYREIGLSLRIPKSTLSNWLSKETWSRKTRGELESVARNGHRNRITKLNKIRGTRLEKIYEEARKEAVEEAKAFRDYPLFIAGLMLYWGEGDKVTRSKVRIANTDPKMIALFRLFLEDVCGVAREDVRASLLIYPDLDDDSVKNFWAMQTGIPLTNFIKSTTIQGRHKTKRLGYGICNIYVSSTYLKTKVSEWLEIVPRELIDTAYYGRIEKSAGMV